MLHPVVLVGGSGTRLWPLSRKSYPKQFLPLGSKHSLLQETLLRLRNLDVAAPVFLCNNEHRFLVAEQLQELGVKPEALILEPKARNTAPAIAAAALILLRQNADALMLVLPSDHVIQNVPAFHAAVERATHIAEQGLLVTFGIKPHHAETGYGYIKRGESFDDDANIPAYRVSCFEEKPDQVTAENYVASGEYSWNGGMFLFQAQTYIDELEKFQPEIVSHCRLAVEGAYEDLDFCRLEETSFTLSPNVSIDVAVMEKTDRAVVVPVDIGWSDIGSWSALWEMQPKDEQGNATVGEVFVQDAKNCYIHAERRLIAAVGVDDLVIVETADAVLVAHRDHAQNVKKIVEWLGEEGRSEHETHRKMFTPWGSYEGIERGERFQVKRIIVKSGHKLSLQSHHHRAEHWIVVSGTAHVTVGEEIRMVTENESIYIPLGANHRIENRGRIPLHFIEVQSGAYLGEDDIVRHDDPYGRDKK